MLANGFHDVPSGKLAMVVTHLEMRAPAPLRDVVLPDGLNIRKVSPDLDWYRDVFTRVGGLDWLWYGRLRLNDAELGAILNDPDVHVWTIEKDGRDEALLELDFRSAQECELAYFGVTPALMGAGAGAALMNMAITQAWSAPLHRFHVHTCTIDSQQALGFYIRSGFKPTRQQIEIDDDPRLLGILPEDAGQHVPILRGGAA